MTEDKISKEQHSKSMYERREEKKKQALLEKLNHIHDSILSKDDFYTLIYENSNSIELLREVLQEIIDDVYK